MAQNYVLLETISLTQTASSVVFDNLPSSGYTDLKVVMSARLDAADQDTVITLNSSITKNAGVRLYGNGSAYSSDTAVGGPLANQPGYTANVFGNSEVYFPNYRSTRNKVISIDSVNENNGSQAYQILSTQSFTSSSAITSIAIAANTGSFIADSTFSLYGVAELGTTPVTGPFASGGNIVANDGTYWYHAFLSSGTFTPLKALSCDTLVIAGGGGGGGAGQGAAGGGGAGGVRGLTAQSFANSTNHAITIGAGGAGGLTTGTYVGTNGSVSSIIGGALSISASGGGGGGGANGSPLVGQNGGSGGGGSGGFVGGTGNVGGYTPVEGFAGGTAISRPDNGAGGGGATAQAAQPSSTRSVGGSAGGAGTNAYSTWATATTTGVSSYYAGGGGGGGYYDGAPSAGGAGGGGTGGGGTGGSNIAAGAATTNTGSGGGAAGNYNTWTMYPAGAGGSGIVIIRYPMV